jgi:hypothetical protein
MIMCNFYTTRGFLFQNYKWEKESKISKIGLLGVVQVTKIFCFYFWNKE